MKIIFSQTDGVASKAIQLATGCKYQHAAVIFDDIIIEARFTGVVQSAIEEFKSRGDFEVFDYPLVDEEKALAFALEQLGKDYDFVGITTFPFRTKWQDPTKWYCSELVAAIAKEGGKPIASDTLQGVSPRDLLVTLKYIELGVNNSK